MKRRVLAILAALVMFVSAVGVPTITRAETTGRAWEWTRLEGTSRYSTMAAITDEAYPASQNGKLKNLIVATGDDFPDALSGAALAGVLGCPIITTKTATLRSEAKKEIERLASKDGCTVYILGGPVAVSDEVMAAIDAIEGVTAQRIQGSNREATAIDVYNMGKAAENGFAGNDTFILATGGGYADTLSISPYAYASKTPIFLTRTNGNLRDSVKEVLLDEANGFKKAIIVGGENAVTVETENTLKEGGIEVLRLFGRNRYATSAEIVKWELGLNTDAAIQPAVQMKSEGMGVATGQNFADALASVNLLGKTKSVLLLVRNLKSSDQPNIDELVATYTPDMTKGYIFGGANAVTEETEALLNEAVPMVPIYETPEEILTALYALDRNEILSGGHKYELEGKITAVNTRYDEGYNNITVTMAVEGFEDKPVQAFRLTADAADEEMSAALKILKTKDKIKVRGILKDYNGTKEFDAGCLLIGYEEGTEPVVIYETPEEILKALYALGENEVLSGGYLYELEGKIIGIKTPYANGVITVTIVVEGFDDYPVQCYKLTAEEGNTEMLAALENLKKGDTIKVKGSLKDYYGTKEFDEGCLLLAYEAAPEEEDVTWSKVAWAAITEEDTIAITMTRDGVTYLLPAEPATANPGAVPATIADGVLTTKGSDGFGWVREAATGGYKFRRGASTDQYLYSASSGTGVRVGTISGNVNEIFDLDTSINYLKSTKNNRHLGIYSGASGYDWRAYASSNFSNIENQTLEFWKLGEGGEQPPEKTDQQKVEEQAAALVLSEGPYTEETIVTLPLPELYPETTIVWSSESTLAVIDEAQEKLTITLPEDEDKTVPVKATLTLGTGSTERIFNLQIKKAEAVVIYETPEEILKALYELEPGETLSDGYEYELEGTITVVVTKYSEQFNNITVTIVVGEYTDYPVVAYRLTADAANEEMTAALPILKENDTIKVKGALTNFGGTYEFEAGSLLIGYTAGEEPPEPEDVTWTEVEWANITAEDIIAITMTKDDQTWILPGTNGTAAAPEAVAITITDGKITTKGSDNYGWIREAIADSDGYSLRRAITTDEYLYFTATNNGVRVGKVSPFQFWLSTSENGTHLTGYASDVQRFVGVYITGGAGQDWRCYAYTNAGAFPSNVKNQTVRFWKLDGGEEPPVGPTDDEKLETEYLNLNLGPISVGPGIVSEDMTYPLPLEGGTYPEVKITWISDKDNVAVVDGNLVITQIDEEVLANVTATLSLNGKTRTKNFPITVKALPEEGIYAFTTEPAAQEGYKWGVKMYNQEEIQVYYFNGKKDGNFLAVTDKPEEAVDVFLEEAEGGFYVSFDDGTRAKKYLAARASGNYVNFFIEDAPETVFTFDRSFYTLCVDDPDKGLQFAGTFGTNVSIRLSSAETYLKEALVDATQFPARFFELLTGDEEPTDEEKLADEKGCLELTKTTFEEAETITLPVSAAAEIAWTSSAPDYAKIVGNELQITIPAADLEVTLTAAMTLGTASTVKEFKLTLIAPKVTATWKKVAWEDITENDVIAITMSKDGTTWVLPGTNGSGSAPTAVVVTPADGAFTTEGSEDYGWVREAADAAGQYKFRFAKTEANYLYTTTSNNGVRVGTNANNVFVLESNYLKNVATGRYIGVFNGQDWRCYTGIAGTNIDNQTLEFWKLEDGGEEPPSSSFDVTIWIQEADEELIRNQIEAFNSTNTDGLFFNPTFVVVSWAEIDSLQDSESCGDLFWFSQTYFPKLMRLGLLSELDTETASKISSENTEGVVKAVRTAEGALYGYPWDVSSTYFMYYNKDAVPENALDSMEAILEACENTQLSFGFDDTSGWYLVSWFFATGCVSEWTRDESGAFVSLNDTFDSEKGLIAAKGLYRLVSSGWTRSTSSCQSLGENCLAVVSGIWDYEEAKAILGDKLGVTDLPSFTVDGETYHLSSFNNCDLLGVKPQTDEEKEAALHKLAQYLTGEQCQTERYTELGKGPSNLAAQASPAVQENEALAALLKQSPYSVPQGPINDSWWGIAQILAREIRGCDGSDAGLTRALDAYRIALADLINVDPEVARAFTVIGAINGTYWDTDFPMTEESDGVWVSDPMYLPEGTEFKCRKGLSWDVSYGKDGENFIVEETGTYRIRLTLTGNDGVIDLISVAALRVGHSYDYSGIFNPFFYKNAYDADVVSLTQLSLMTTDRLGGVIYNGIEGQTVNYHGTDYVYTGPADLSVNYDQTTGLTTYTAKLRSGMKFSDGVEITADDLIFTYYTKCDPSYDGSGSLQSYDIVGLRQYQTGVTDEVYNRYVSLAAEIYSAGHNNYAANSQYSETLYNAYWNKLDGLWVAAAQDIVDYIMDSYCNDQYAEQYLGLGTTAEQIRANEGMQVAFAMILWGFGSMFEGEFEDTLGHVYHETWPTTADFYENIYEKYAGDLETAWGNENAGGVNPLSTTNNWFIRTYGAQDPAMSGVEITSIEGIRKLDKYTVQVVTNGYEAPAVYTILGDYITPMHYYGDEAKYDYENNKFGFDFGDLSKQRSRNEAPMGAGPYKFVSYAGKNVTFEANENYYRGCPKTEVFQFIGSDDVLNDLEGGLINIGEMGGTNSVYNVIRSMNTNAELTGDIITTALVDHNGYGYIGINAETVNVNGDPDSDASKAFRKALATIIAVFREETVASYYGDAAKVIQYPISNTSWAAPQSTDSGYQTAFSKWVDGTDIYGSWMGHDERVAAAKDAALRWFEEAGYTVADGEIVDAPAGGPMSVEYLTSGGHPCDGALDLAKEALSEMGFELTITNAGFTGVTNAIYSGTHQLWAMAWGSTIDPDLFQIYHSSNIGTGSNYYGINDPQLDELILEARMSDDQNVRKQLYKQCFDIIMDWGVEIPVYQRQNCTVFSTQQINISTLTPDITTNWSWIREVEKVELN